MIIPQKQGIDVKEGSELFLGLSQSAVPKECTRAQELELDDLPHVTIWLISIVSSAHICRLPQSSAGLADTFHACCLPAASPASFSWLSDRSGKDSKSQFHLDIAMPQHTAFLCMFSAGCLSRLVWFGLFRELSELNQKTLGRFHLDLARPLHTLFHACSLLALKAFIALSDRSKIR